MLIFKANKREQAKSSPTFKALDFVEILPKDLGAAGAGAGLRLCGLGVRVRVSLHFTTNIYLQSTYKLFSLISNYPSIHLILGQQTWASQVFSDV